jgi:DNA-binding transcriptional regulator LsrR (DeoR family)
MSQDLVAGPGELVLMASICRRYYLHGESKSDIAERTGLSRFKVARLLDRAREAGLVRIEIGWPGAIDVALSATIQERFALNRVIVVSMAEEQPEAMRRGVGEAAASLLSEVVTADDVLGLAWGRSLTVMAGALTRLASCEVVQLTGALQREDTQASSVDLVRDVARLGGGPAYYFHAPMIVADPQIAAALREQPEVAKALSRISAVTKAFVGVGGWRQGASTVIDAVAQKEVDALAARGVTAEISGILIDADGQPVSSSLDRRTIGIRAEQLRAIPDVTALAYGAAKAPAVRAALASGMVDGLVTTRDLAAALLESEPA